MRRELLALALKGIAGTAYFARGKTYHDQNRVQWLDENDEGVDARVRGTRDYTVQLWEEGGKIRYNCDCPVGQDGEFCKHCIAAALAWLGETEPQPARLGEAPPKPRSAIEDRSRFRRDVILVPVEEDQERTRHNRRRRRRRWRRWRRRRRRPIAKAPPRQRCLPVMPFRHTIIGIINVAPAWRSLPFAYGDW